MSGFSECDLYPIGDCCGNAVIDGLEIGKGFFNISGRIQCCHGARRSTFFSLMSLSFERRVFFLNMGGIAKNEFR